MGELFRKGEECKAVPWKDWKEWIDVYDELTQVGKSYDLPYATDSMIRWHTRGKIPLYVEATLAFLTIFKQDKNRNFSNGQDGPASDALLLLMYGQALTRFVNLLTDSIQEGAVASSMDKLAGSLYIPAWIVQCRHTVTHGHSPPTINTMRNAADFLLEEYLIPRYWKAQRLLIPDSCLYTATTSSESSKDLLDILFGDSVELDDLGVEALTALLDAQVIHSLVTCVGEDLERKKARIQIILEQIVRSDIFETIIHEAMFYGNIEFLHLAIVLREISAYTMSIIICRCSSEHCRLSQYQISELLSGKSLDPVLR